MKKVLVFQHIEIEDLGLLKSLFKKENIFLKYIKLYDGDFIPDNLEEYSLMISLGGSMNTWMEDEYPWLKKEKKAIRKFVIDLNKPFIGLCLGCQLLGEVLGGEIKKSKKTELGFCKISLNSDKDIDPIFKNFPQNFDVFQWHSYEVTNLDNANICILGASETTPIQLFRYKDNAYGIQFHIETEKETIRNWCSEKNYRKELQEKIGLNALESIEKDQEKLLKDINKLCSIFFLNIIKYFLNSEN